MKMETSLEAIAEIMERVARLEARLDAATTNNQLLREALFKQIMMKIEGQGELLNQAQGSAQRAVDKAEEAQQLRNAQQNEWRNTLSDVAKNQVSVDTFHAEVRRLEERITAGEKRDENKAGESSGIKLTSGVLLSSLVALALLITILTAFSGLFLFVVRR